MAEPPDSFAALLAQADSVSMPRRGDLLRGVILSIDSQGAIVDLGLKLDGVIPRADLDRLPAEIAPKRAWTYRQVAWLALGAGLFPLAIGEALGTPVLVAAVRRYSTTRQRSLSFSIFWQRYHRYDLPLWAHRPVRNGFALLRDGAEQRP